MPSTQFRSDQFNALYPEGIEQYYWSAARSSIIVDFLKKAGLQKKPMLEIGCGKGVVLRALRASGFDCYGVDLAQAEVPPDLASHLHYGVSFESLNPALIARVEVVLLFDVIEHIEDERKFLELIRQTFPNLTEIVVTVPARSELWSNFDTYNGHFRRYTRTSMKEVVHEAGFVSKDLQYFFHTLYIPARIFSFFKATRRTAVVPPRGFSVLLHKIAAWFFFVEYKVVPRNIPGTSIIGLVVPEDNRV